MIECISFVLVFVRAKNEAIGLGLTRAHNLFVKWTWISYVGLFSAQRLTEIISLSLWITHLTLFFVSLQAFPTSLPPLASHIYSQVVSGGIIIAFKVSAIGGPISLIVSGCLGGNGVW